jgi:hypothetical protein
MTGGHPKPPNFFACFAIGAMHGGLALSQTVDVHNRNQIVELVMGGERRSLPDASLGCLAIPSRRTVIQLVHPAHSAPCPLPPRARPSDPVAHPPTSDAAWDGLRDRCRCAQGKQLLGAMMPACPGCVQQRRRMDLFERMNRSLFGCFAFCGS